MIKNVLICQSSPLKSLDTISYASNNGTTKSGRRVQKHDDGRNESDSPRIKLTQIQPGDHLTDHKYDRFGLFLALQDI